DGVWPILAHWWDILTGGSGRSERRRDPPPKAAVLPQRPRPETGKVVLEVDALRKEVGGLVAVNDISFTLPAGEIMGLMSPTCSRGCSRAPAASSDSRARGSPSCPHARFRAVAWAVPSRACSCCQP